MTTIDLAGGEGFHRRDVLEPLEADVDALLPEPPLLEGDLPRDPAVLRAAVAELLREHAVGAGPG